MSRRCRTFGCSRRSRRSATAAARRSLMIVCASCGPVYLPPPRSFQRTVYRPGELAQFDLTEPRREIPVGYGQTRKGYVVTCKLSLLAELRGRADLHQGVLADIAWGMSRCLARLGALPKKLVWDREGAIPPQAAGPPTAFAAFCGRAFARLGLPRSRAIARPRGCLSAITTSCTATSRPAAASPTSSTSRPSSTVGCQRDQLQRKHRATRAIVSERLAAEREQMRALPERHARHRPPLGGAGSRRSRICASTATTTRSTRASLVGGSRCARASAR